LAGAVMPQQPKNDWIDDDPAWQDDTPPIKKDTIGKSLVKGLTEGLPELQMLPPEKYPGATRQDWIGDVSRASMYPVGAAAELYNKIIRPVTSPSNLALLGMSILQPETIPITASVFGAQQAMQVPGQVRDVTQSFNKTGLSGETVGKVGELGLNTLMMGGALHGGSKFMEDKVTPPPSNIMRFRTEPGFGETVAKQGLGLTESTPVESGSPIRPPVRPDLAASVAGQLKTEPTIFDNITKPTPVDTSLNTIEGVQTAYNSGKISQDNAIKLLQQIHWDEINASKVTKSVKLVEPVEAIKVGHQEGANNKPGFDIYTVTKGGNTEHPNNSTVSETTLKKMGWTPPKEEPDFTTLAKQLVEEPSSVDSLLNDISKIKAPPKIESPVNEPTIVPPNEIPKVENPTYIFKKEEVSPEFIKQARDRGYEFQGLNDNGDFRFKKTDTSIPDIPPVKLLDQLPTPLGLSDVIKAIPRDTGDEVLNSMVASLRAMRRRKGIDTFNPRETNAYNGLMEQVKNHPNLLPELKTRWDAITSPITESTVQPTPIESSISEPKTNRGFLTLQELTERNDRAQARVKTLRESAKTESSNIGPIHQQLQDANRYAKAAGMRLSAAKKTQGQSTNRLTNFLKSEKGELNIDLNRTPKTLKEEPIKPISPEANAIVLRIKDKTPAQAGALREAWNLSRGLMSVDLPFITSAGFRQGFPLIGTKNWFKAWIPSIKAYGSKDAFLAHSEMIKADPLVQRQVKPVLGLDGKPLITKGQPVYKETPSITEQAGVKFTDVGSLSTREEAIRSQLGERIPIYGHHVAASNRSYTAYINDARLGAFRNFYDAMPNKNDLVALKKLGEAANNFTGRGKLAIEVPFTGGKELSIERYASGLAEVLFAPKLIASRIHMLNPMNYVMGNPQVRKQYLYAALRMAGAWTTLGVLANQMGAEVSLNPTSSDFGKIKIGNFRLDPAAGFQQFLVLASRLWNQETTSSVTGKTRQFGVGYNPSTWGSTLTDFTLNKLHPSLKYFVDAAFASEKKPFPVIDRAFQTVIPMMSGDLISIAIENPELLPIFAPLVSGGMGAQFYTGKDYGKSQFIPSQYDWTLGKKH
jgi:hypothetical protein